MKRWSSKRADRLSRQCGYPHNSLSFMSSGNVMLLTLVTSDEKNFPGFRANYSQIAATEQSTSGSRITTLFSVFNAAGRKPEQKIHMASKKLTKRAAAV